MRLDLGEPREVINWHELQLPERRSVGRETGGNNRQPGRRSPCCLPPAFPKPSGISTIRRIESNAYVEKDRSSL